MRFFSRTLNSYMIDDLVNACRFDSCLGAQMSHIRSDKRCQIVGRYPENFAEHVQKIFNKLLCPAVTTYKPTDVE